MAKVRKTDPCPCGSGKKYKYCHGTPAEAAVVDDRPPRRQIFIWIIIVLLPIAYAATWLQSDPQVTAAKRVWSEAHGHYHTADGGEIGAAAPAAVAAPTANVATPATADDPTATTAAVPATAPGPAPPGKIWDPVHGHWHDDPNSGTPDLEPIPDEEGFEAKKYQIERPDGPTPEGKTWSQAHGHWHDNDAP